MSGITEKEIEEMVVEWVLDHEDEVSQSERWRTVMQKKNAKRFDKVERGLSQLSMTMKELKRSGNSYEQKLSRIEELLLEGRGDDASPQPRRDDGPTTPRTDTSYSTSRA